MAKRANRIPGPLPPDASVTEPGRIPPWLAFGLIVTAAFWVYSPVFHGDWLWDDDWYVTGQPLLRDAAGLWKFWFAPGSFVEYYPVEETLLWIEWHLFGTDTLGYHLVTIALHAVNALLVWRLLARLGLRKAWLGGLLFAVHPVAVDSVAWISETKNTLVLVPCLLSLIAWIDYEQSRRRRDYGRALALFVVAMLCKISVATLPLVLLLYVGWQRRRIGWDDVKATLPFFAISLALCLLTIACGRWYYLDHDQFGHDFVLSGWPMRLALTGQTLVHYLAHVFWPVGLLPVYPQWKVDPSALPAFLPWLVFILGVIALWTQRAGWGRPALLGGGFFFLLLAPFLGFFGTSFMNFTWIMDHFLYVPVIGLIGLFVALLQRAEDHLSPAARPALTGFITGVVALLAFEAHALALAYTDEATLWTYTLEHDPDSWIAHYNLGNALFLANHFPQAAAEYERTLQLNPDHIQAHNNLGLAYAQTGRLPEAIAQFQAALQLMPTYASARHNLDQAEALLHASPTKP